MKRGSKRGSTLRKHKRSGRGYAKFNGRQVWFGPFDDRETHAGFAAFKARGEANRRTLPGAAPAAGPYRVRDLVADFLDHLEAKHDAGWLAEGHTGRCAGRPEGAPHPQDQRRAGTPLINHDARCLRLVDTFRPVTACSGDSHRCPRPSSSPIRTDDLHLLAPIAGQHWRPFHAAPRHPRRRSWFPRIACAVLGFRPGTHRVRPQPGAVCFRGRLCRGARRLSILVPSRRLDHGFPSRGSDGRCLSRSGSAARAAQAR